MWQLTQWGNDVSPRGDVYTRHVAHVGTCVCMCAHLCACVCTCVHVCTDNMLFIHEFTGLLMQIKALFTPNVCMLYILSIFLSFCTMSCYDLKIDQFMDKCAYLNIMILILIIFKIITMF